MALDFDQVVEGVGAAQLAGMDQAHEQIADLRTVKGAIKQGILTVKNYALQGPFYYVKMLKTLAGWYLGLALAEHSCGLPSP